MLGVLAAALMLAVAPSMSVHADAPTRVGWWWTARSGGLPTPAPPSVPPNGMYIASNPTGAEAVAALRFDLPAGSIPEQLRLQVAASAGTPIVLLCLVTGPWEAADGGPFEDRAPSDCARTVAGVLAGGGTTLSFDLANLFGEARVVDAVLVPAADPTVPTLGSTFQLSLQPPDVAALLVRNAPSPAAPDAPAAVLTPTTNVDAASPPALALPPLAPLQTAVADPAPVAAPGAALPAPGAVRPLGGDAGGAGERVLGGLLLVGLAGAAVWVLRQPRPAILGLGPFTRRSDGADETPVVRGIGRFTKARVGPRPTIR
jgi:hypothetical protein